MSFEVKKMCTACLLERNLLVALPHLATSIEVFSHISTSTWYFRVVSMMSAMFMVRRGCQQGYQLETCRHISPV